MKIKIKLRKLSHLFTSIIAYHRVGDVGVGPDNGNRTVAASGQR